MFFTIFSTFSRRISTNFTFFQQIITNCLRHGNFYTFIQRDMSCNPIGLWP